MSYSPPRIFISYARQDGHAAAEAFEGRLKAAGITAWRDIKDIVGGEGILPQVLDAIGQAEHLVPVLLRGALASGRRRARKRSPIDLIVLCSWNAIRPW
ncbi:TIR domain-containing protein [Azospirillum sp. Vi22]|uniref:toll/interleukin-1 receptor domain-containing protein n=1 Tax=Azospirillum baldaniorum TaxID=1064539 RepID=UPI00157B16CD|nr:toll/interleukin-1 receptor domain-containing protein [Azospirillum baldaniorum]NUB06292.1 TIR domain-containing protein [Azospirillum baldaniorum]